MRNLALVTAPAAAAALVVALASAPAWAADASKEAWDALVAGGHVALIRHGNAPGPSVGQGGEPPGFRLDDCMTQRNLDDRGAQRPERWARLSAPAACEWTTSGLHPGVAAWKRPS